MHTVLLQLYRTFEGNMSTSPKLKLVYFDIGGRAEATRLALVQGGIEFENAFVNFPEWMAMKESMPFKQLPVRIRTILCSS